MLTTIDQNNKIHTCKTSTNKILKEKVYKSKNF